MRRGPPQAPLPARPCPGETSRCLLPRGFSAGDDARATRGEAATDSGALGIGGLSVFPPLVMAPMAGLTHPAYRRLVSEFAGVGLYYSEMLSARSLPHERPGTSRHLLDGGPDRPLCIQIFASSPEQVGAAVEGGSRWDPEAWDLNLGCPAPVIVRQGAGSALADDPLRARQVAAEMRRHVKGPLLFKIRAHRDPARFTDLAQMLVDEGADAIVVHGRAPGEKLGRPAKWSPVREAAQRLPVPVIGNGDVATPGDAVRMMRETGCAGVMIGRAAAERPWVFRSAARALGAKVPPPPYRRKSEVYLRLSALLREELGHPRDLYRLRRFTQYFAKNFKFGHGLWKSTQNAGDIAEAEEKASAFFDRHGEEDALDE